MSELRTQARLLLQTVEDRLVEWRSLVPTGVAATAPTAATAAPGSGSPALAPPEHADHVDHAAPGNGCPLCTLLAVLRGERPELTAALLDGAMTALQVARSLVSQEPAGPSSPDQPGRAQRAGQPDQPDQPATHDLGPPPPPTTESSPSPDPALPAATRRRTPERIRIS